MYRSSEDRHRPLDFRRDGAKESGLPLEPGGTTIITYDDLRAIVLAFPDTVETTSWDARSFKVNGKAILFWNPTYDCPVFKVPLDERDFLIEADPDTFFTTDHHRPYALVLARPDRLDPGWAEANIERVWRARAKKRTVKAWDTGRGDG